MELSKIISGPDIFSCLFTLMNYKREGLKPAGKLASSLPRVMSAK